MESYGYRKRKNGNFFKYILVILVTVAITLYVNNAMQKASEIDDFARRLSSSGENMEKGEITEFNATKTSNYIERVVQSTVGIGLIKPSGTSVFDLDLARKWGLRNGNNSIRKRIYINKSTFGTKSWSQDCCDAKHRQISTRKDSLGGGKHRPELNKSRRKRLDTSNIRRFK